MKASWVQTIVMAAIGAAVPFLNVLASGGPVNAKTFMWSVITAVVVAVGNILRSPVTNPPTMIAAKPPEAPPQ